MCVFLKNTVKRVHSWLDLIKQSSIISNQTEWDTCNSVHQTHTHVCSGVFDPSACDYSLSLNEMHENETLYPHFLRSQALFVSDECAALHRNRCAVQESRVLETTACLWIFMQNHQTDSEPELICALNHEHCRRCPSFTCSALTLLCVTADSCYRKGSFRHFLFTEFPASQPLPLYPDALLSVFLS